MRRKIPEDLTLSDAQVGEVIERAARTAPHSEGVSLPELREIAVELDIAPDSLERALREVLRPTPSRRMRSWWDSQLTRLGRVADRFLPGRGRLAAAAATGGLLGWASAAVMSLAPFTVGSIDVVRGAGGIVDVPVAIGLIVLTLANSFSRRASGGLARYLRESWTLWLGFGVGWSVAHGSMTGELLQWVAICVVGTTVWGWLVVRGHQKDHAGNHPFQALPDRDGAGDYADSDSDHDGPMKYALRGRVSRRRLGLA